MLSAIWAKVSNNLQTNSLLIKNIKLLGKTADRESHLETHLTVL